jgi:hypothetical protein
MAQFGIDLVVLPKRSPKFEGSKNVGKAFSGKKDTFNIRRH